MDKENLNLLQRLGLNQYESRLYLALLSSGAASASSLSDTASIPRPRTYDVLEKLEKRGFVQIQPGRPVKFKAIEIKTALNSLKDTKKRELQKELEEVDKIHEQLHSKIQLTPAEDIGSTDMVWVLKDRNNIYSKINSLIESASKEIVISTTKDGLERKINEHGNALRSAKKRGVDIKVISPESAHLKKAREFAKTVSKDHNNRFTVIDDHVMLFLTPEDNPKKEVGAWIHSPYFAQNVKKLI